MMSSLVAPGGNKLALSSFGRIRSRQLSVASKSQSPLVVKPGGGCNTKSRSVLDAAQIRCGSSSAITTVTTSVCIAGGGNRRRPDSPISDARRATRLAAVATGDAVPKPTFDKENGGYTKSFLVVRLTVFLR